MGDLFADLGQKILDGLNSALQSILYNTIYKLMYYIDVGLSWLVGILYKMFGIFAGTEPVKYVDAGGMLHEGDLISFFIGHDSISRVYWIMALVGIVLCFGFTIIAVIRKMADLDGKQQRAYGQILRSTGKSILIILLMTAIMTGVLQVTNVITDAVDRAFTFGSTSGESKVEFEDDHYATMARVLNTVGNYSLNTAPTSRYNLNACFNDIRPDLQWLQEQGIFDIYYADKNTDGSARMSWQSELQKIVNSTDLRQDISMDVYNESLASALTNLMKVLNSDASFKPLASPYTTREYNLSAADTPLDVILFLMGTSDAANNENYNVTPSLTDNLRGGYYIGEKSIYDVGQVMHDFDIAIGTFDHILIIFGAITMIPNLVICVFNAIARMFNLLMLYLMAPLAAAPTPMDDGGKFKQWTTAFVIQCFGILGIIVSMRLLILFLPFVTNSDITFFDNATLNIVARLLLLIGGTEAAKKASGIITGILADNAGIQSLAAGDMSGFAGKAMSRVGGMAMGAAKTVGGVASDALGISAATNSIKEGYKKFSDKGGVFGIGSKSAEEKQQEQEQAKTKKNVDATAEAMVTKFKEAGFGGFGGSSSAPNNNNRVSNSDANNAFSNEVGGKNDSAPNNNNRVSNSDANDAFSNEVDGKNDSAPNDNVGSNNKKVPPISSEEFNDKLNADKGPDSQENMAAK